VKGGKDGEISNKRTDGLQNERNSERGRMEYLKKKGKSKERWTT
jgi:hypothetical protein